MILSRKTREYFKSLQSKVTQAMAQNNLTHPYLLEDHFIRNYEMVRSVWLGRMPIINVCQRHDVSRSLYYEMERRFTQSGIIGLLPEITPLEVFPDLEKLVLLINEARPSVSQQAILRIAESMPTTSSAANISTISQILASYGTKATSQLSDKYFWGRIQRTLSQVQRQANDTKLTRDVKNRTETFFHDKDISQNRLELLREISMNSLPKIYETCVRYSIAPSSYYRLEKDYRILGPWSIVSAHMPGKEGVNSETELRIILLKLRNPTWSAQELVKFLNLRCSRYAVSRILSRWKITDKNRSPIAIDQHVEVVEDTDQYQERRSAYHLQSEQTLLETRRINRHFELISDKMRTHAYHICDPGPILLAPFVSDLGIAQAMESHGPTKLRGKEITNLALLNVFRIIGGYRRINHLSNNSDHSVAIASGIGMFGTCSRYYEDTLEFKFKQIHELRCDLVIRAKELEIIEGMKIAFDFHFKEFYGSSSKEKGIGKGPSKSGDLVPGFRPHVAWDLATNTILSMSYYHGGVRSSGIIEQYCEQHIFSLIDPRAVSEIYMDSEYTKEGTLQYFKQIRCPNGEVFLCLKKNKQIKKLIAPALEESTGWSVYNNEDECKSVDVVLPHTQLPLKIILLRDLKSKINVRCFGSTDMEISKEDLLKKYRYRWLIENGLKDLVYSYFLDEIYGNDPEKIEFEFYCVMVARLAYEHFLKELGGKHFKHTDGNKTTLGTMRNLLFEKRNATIELGADNNYIMTLLDTDGNEFEQQVSRMLDEKIVQETNKVLWWGNRGIRLRFKNQYKSAKV